jgi:hypothetical protein
MTMVGGARDKDIEVYASDLETFDLDPFRR